MVVLRFKLCLAVPARCDADAIGAGPGGITAARCLADTSPSCAPALVLALA